MVDDINKMLRKMMSNISINKENYMEKLLLVGET